MKIRKRCPWARNPLAIAYHDREWGVPVRDDRKLFEFLLLEGAQAGLSKDLKRRGFKFVGSTIMYAFMQAVGLVDDHLRGCFRAAKGCK